MIGWDGRVMKHCSACLDTGILSFFGSSVRRVNDHCNALEALRKRRSFKGKKLKDTIKEGAMVTVRKKVYQMKHSATTQHIPMGKKPMTRRAVVIKLVDNNKAVIEYAGNLHGEPEIIDIKHIALCST